MKLPEIKVKAVDDISVFDVCILGRLTNFRTLYKEDERCPFDEFINYEFAMSDPSSVGLFVDPPNYWISKMNESTTNRVHQELVPESTTPQSSIPLKDIILKFIQELESSGLPTSEQTDPIIDEEGEDDSVVDDEETIYDEDDCLDDELIDVDEFFGNDDLEE
jgi:hypothetical protein